MEREPPMTTAGEAIMSWRAGVKFKLTGKRLDNPWGQFYV
jgi:hypothetical protein